MFLRDVFPGLHHTYGSMTKSELIELLARRQPHLKADDVDLSVKSLLQMMGSRSPAGSHRSARAVFPHFRRAHRPTPRPGRRRAAGKHPAFQAGQECADG
jgi:integration host factor subunit beta